MEFKEKSAYLSSLDVNERGYESVSLSGNSAIGSILRVGQDGKPFEIKYQFVWDNQFQIIEATVDTFKKESHLLHLTFKEGWYKDGLKLLGFDDCTDIDLWPSPFTNTLVIKRLNLNVGESKEICVIWIDGPSITFKRVKQIYKRISDRMYEFQAPEENFKATLSVDSEGLIVLYPNLFSRI